MFLVTSAMAMGCAGIKPATAWLAMGLRLLRRRGQLRSSMDGKFGDNLLISATLLRSSWNLLGVLSVISCLIPFLYCKPTSHVLRRNKKLKTLHLSASNRPHSLVSLGLENFKTMERPQTFPGLDERRKYCNPPTIPTS